MACRQFDIVVEKPGLALGPMNPIMMGCPTVDIGGPTASMSINGGVATVTWGAMTITGSPDDVATFIGMLGHALTSTNAGGGRIAAIIGDTANPITVNAGRNQPGTFVDRFDNNNVDLADLEQFPASPRPAHPNEASQDEMLVHFLTERAHDSQHGTGFNDAHTEGLDAQNEMRDERGQSRVTSQVFADPPTNQVVHFNYADGSQEVINLSGSDVSSITPP
jgi:hypothetical protein